MAVVTRTFTFAGPPVPIPDNNVAGISNILAVSGVPTGATITKMTVNLTIPHTLNSELDISLVDPEGNIRQLSTDNGGAGGNYTNVTFDDSSANPINDVGFVGPITGTFSPESPLFGLYPGAINGNWTLRVADDAPADTGSLNSWTLTITYNDNIIIPDTVRVIVGTVASESLIGGANVDLIVALGGSDALFGKEGNDRLLASDGSQVFVFDTALNALTNVDDIVGFSHRDDTFQLENSIFTSINQLGTLKNKFFVSANKAADKNDFIIYSKNTGELSYDADGKKGAFQSIVFAQLEDHLKIKADDFYVA